MQIMLLELNNIASVSGYSYVCYLPPEVPIGDTEQDPTKSNVEIFEDGKALGPAHAEHDDIRSRGGGRFSHWHDSPTSRSGVLYFSASDNTDPRSNGRSYRMYVPQPTSKLQRRLGLVVARARDDFTEYETYDMAEALFKEVFPSGFIGDVSKLCWKDHSFVAAYRRLCPFNDRSFERKYVVSQLVMALKHLNGDLAECGVYNGATSYFMARAGLQVGVHRSMHLFDSFAGLSEPAPLDGSYWESGRFAIPEDVARSNLQKFKDVHFYKGWIPERFDEVADRKFVFVHVDVDLYRPTRDCFDFFYPRIVPGGMMVCDDYGFTTCPGAYQAVQEFMEDKPEHLIHLPTGQAVIIRT
jgi:hypothetical protein